MSNRETGAGQTEAARGVRATAATLLVWVSLAAACTLLLAWEREVLDKAHMALAYMVLVLLASANAGRTVGITLALLCFLSFNFFLLPPYHTFIIAEPLDWLVLVAFLIVSTVGAELLHRVQREAENARRRAAEVDRLSRLGAESLSVARAEDAVDAVARVIRAELPITGCEVYRPQGKAFERMGPADPDGGSRPGVKQDLLRLAMDREAIVVERTDGSTHLIPTRLRFGEGIASSLGATSILMPLRARDHLVGVLRMTSEAEIALDASQARFAGALADYAALGLERVRLATEAARAASLQEADRLKDAFLANVSHDLRTPLTTIKALAHEIRADGDDRAAIIEQESDRLNRLVADLLDLSRINAGGMSVAPEINAADDLVGAALERVSGIPGAAAIHPSIVELDGLLLGRFDFVQALRALVNLLENALKYSGNAPVELEVHRHGDRLVLDVLDRGPGLSPDEAERVFEPFQRGESASAPGTGLGLTIARRLAEAQNGSVLYQPRAGGGSVFSLFLPAVDVTEPLIT
jgi:two-component system sensor histidine kinase KdpD